MGRRAGRDRSIVGCGRPASYFAVAGVCSLFGVIHSPFEDERLFLPWALGDTLPHAAAGQSPFGWLPAYLLVAVMLLRVGSVERAASSGGAMSMLQRVLEPELMDTADEAREYDAMDHSAVNRQFVDDLLAVCPAPRDVLDVGTGTALDPRGTLPTRGDVSCDGCRLVARHARTGPLPHRNRRTDHTHPARPVGCQTDAVPGRHVRPGRVQRHAAPFRRSVGRASRIAAGDGPRRLALLPRPAAAARISRHSTNWSPPTPATANEFQQQMFRQSLQAALHPGRNARRGHRPRLRSRSPSKPPAIGTGHGAS